jgi:hypothetical protein
LALWLNRLDADCIIYGMNKLQSVELSGVAGLVHIPPVCLALGDKLLSAWLIVNPQTIKKESECNKTTFPGDTDSFQA